MASYPSSILSPTNPSGTQRLDSPDHAVLHTSHNGEIVAIETVLGATGGTNVLKDFTAGKFAVFTSGGTFDAGVLGTPAITGGTATSTVLRTNTIGTPAITGGTAASIIINTSTINAPTIGTPAITGGTMATGNFPNATLGSPAITGGTGNGMTLGTPIMDKFTTSGTGTPTVAQRGLAPTVVTLTDSAGGTIAVNSALAQVFHLVLGTSVGTRTLAAPANATEGQNIVFRIKQNAGNTGTLAWNAIYRFSDAGTPSLGTNSTYNYYGYRYNSIDTKWDFVGQSKNII